MTPKKSLPTVTPPVTPPTITKPIIVRTRAFAGTVLGLGLAFGLLHSYFFYDQKLGISYPIFMILSCVALWYLGKSQKHELEKWEVLWLVPILFFSTMVAVRSAELLTFANLVVSFFGLLVLVWMRTPVEWERIFQIRRILFLPFAYIANWFSTFVDLRRSYGILPTKVATEKSDKWARIIKGSMISVPLVGLYLVLFASGDLVFRGALGNVANWIGSWNLPPLPDISFGRFWLIIMVMFTAGGMFDAFISKMVFPYKTVGPTGSLRTLGSWETNIPLGVTNIIFLSFALLQLRYALGGYSAIGPEGFTYAEYAKNGYFELSVAAAISFVVIFLIGRQAILQENQLNRLTKWLCIGLAVQVGFVIWCAFSRLSMYQEAYGLTLARFYGYVFLLWMVGAFILLSWKTWTDGNMRIFGAQMTQWVLVLLVGINLSNPSGFVARENISRPSDPEVINSFPMQWRDASSIKVDYGYLSTLSLDAIPEMAPTMNEEQLKQAYEKFKFDPNMPWFSFRLTQMWAVWALVDRGEVLGVKTF